MTGAIDYATPGPFTGLGTVSPAVLECVPYDPVEICRLIPGLILHPLDAKELDVPDARYAENEIRPVADLLPPLLALDAAPLDVARPPRRKAIGTCRHFAVMACAFLRYRGFAARARCGFGTYFRPGHGLDHWITEYWHEGDARWVRVDTEHVQKSLVADPAELREGEFLTGGEAWAAFREGRIDAEAFGVYGTENWGPAEIRGNAIRDLASLNKVEPLPWDEWGRMDASYKGKTGPDYDELLDTIATTCAADDPAAIAALYANDELRVPAELVR